MAIYGNTCCTMSTKSRLFLAFHRDWRGLAQFLGLDSLAIQNLERERNPCEAAIRQAPGNLTVKGIIEFLEKMDRFDVVDDTIALMGKFQFQTYKK